VKVADIGKDFSLLWCGINYGRKKFYNGSFL